MTYRSLLVLIDNDARCAERTQLAIELARAFDCHLVGLAPTGRVDFPVAIEAAAALETFASHAWAALKAQAHASAQTFRESCRHAGLASFEAVVAEDDAPAALVRHAHCSDLTVLGQSDPEQPGHRVLQQMVEQVVLNSARPTLVLPYAGRFRAVARHAMVAWDDSREAARAVADALPLLLRAERVQVVAWNEQPDLDLRPRLDALRQWLAWHGVDAETAVETSTIGIADAMLSRAADQDADLLVMGAYGHLRWTERILGGATRGLLQTMTLPVLMSH